MVQLFLIFTDRRLPNACLTMLVCCSSIIYINFISPSHRRTPFSWGYYIDTNDVRKRERESTIIVSLFSHMF